MNPAHLQQLLSRYSPTLHHGAFLNDLGNAFLIQRGHSPSVQPSGLVQIDRLPADSRVFITSPRLPNDSTVANLVLFALASQAYADHLSHLLSRHFRVGVIHPLAMEECTVDELAPLPKRAIAVALKLSRSLSRQFYLRFKALSFPLPTQGWEVETTDFARDRLTQIPGGEVFAHFDCRWSGRIDVEIPCRQANCLLPTQLLVTGGTIESVHCVQECAHGFVGHGMIGKRITEFGFGINPFLRRSARPWAEKAKGTIHLGIGPRAGDDVAPPDSHFDVLLPEYAICTEYKGE